MNKPYFVMLHNQKATTFVPLMNENNELLMFETYPKAEVAAENTLFGREFGYEIFKEGEGE